jgi:hypothetical protein
MATTIGTSTDLLVVMTAANLRMRELQIFEFAMPVLIVGSFTILYLWLVAPLLLPERNPPIDDNAPRIFDSRLRIDTTSTVQGKSPAELRAITQGRMCISCLDRGALSLAPLPSTPNMHSPAMSISPKSSS